MNRALLGICLITLLSCAQAEAPQKKSPYKQSHETELTSLKFWKIITWNDKTPKERRFLGYLEYCKLQKENLEKKFYWIYDSHYKKVGYISDVGQFYTYEGAELKHLGEYQLNMGLQIFFNIPLSDNKLDIIALDAK